MLLLKRWVFVFLCLPFLLVANTFVYGDKSLLSPKTLDLVEKIGTELFEKTNHGVYVLIYEDKKTKEQRKEILEQFSAQLHPPYFILSFFKENQKIGLIASQDVKNLLDLDLIYKHHIVPLLPIEKSDVLNQQRISAIILNAYAHLADALADKKQVELHHNIVDKHGELLATIAKITLQIMLVILACVVVWVYIIRRNR